jgi:8-amino-7-oxononanoate synthase
MLVNGYHPIHQRFEERLASLNGFEEGIVVGSGFLANMALIEALVRKKDLLFIDEDYHASGMMATGLWDERVIKFQHNDPADLKAKLEAHPNGGRKIIAVEGVYSMSGALCKKEIFDIADKYEALLIVDEAHSSGVVGDKLLGIFEFYNITPNERHIKMGTLGKAYGSYGAYILASSHIISFLINRGKPIIYSTAPSIIDTALALVNIDYVSENHAILNGEIKKRQKVIKEICNITSNSLIISIKVANNPMTLAYQEKLESKGYLIGAIRQPTVNEPILRIIPRLGSSVEALQSMLYEVF